MVLSRLSSILNARVTFLRALLIPCCRDTIGFREQHALEIYASLLTHFTRNCDRSMSLKPIGLLSTPESHRISRPPVISILSKKKREESIVFQKAKLIASESANALLFILHERFFISTPLRKNLLWIGRQCS